MSGFKTKPLLDFPAGPVVKNPPSTAGDVGSVPGRGTKIPRAAGQLSRCTTTEPRRLKWRARVLQLERSLRATTKTRCSQKKKKKQQTLSSNGKPTASNLWPQPGPCALAGLGCVLLICKAGPSRGQGLIVERIPCGEIRLCEEGPWSQVGENWP